MRQVFKHTIFHGREHDRPAGALHRAIGGIELQVANCDYGRGLTFAPADQGFSTGQQFAQIKGLGQIVISPSIQ